MVWWTCCSAETFHLLYKEWYQCAGVLYSCFCLLIEVSLISAATALYHAKELIFVAFCGFDVNLCGEVTTCVDLVIHIEWRILGITQVFLGICLIDTERESLLVAESCPYLLTLLAVYDSSAGILTEW